jgi:hypothetical protein
MRVLEAGEICPYAERCQYNITPNQCQGANLNRKNQFKCSYVDNGIIENGGVRLPQDKTGQMKIIID